MSERLPKIFWEIHGGLPREGPGDNASTRKAYLMLEDLPENPRILDIGCGPGMQTIELAKLSGGQIDALDNHEPFLEDLSKRAKKEGVTDRIRPVKGDMFNLNYNDNSFDLIWSEGAIFVIGFEKGLREWRRLLTDTGYLVVSEMSWLRSDVPKEAAAFMKQAYLGYPEIKTSEENLEIARNSGYRVVDFFVLPSKSWWVNYYIPIEAKLPAMKTKYKDDKKALQFIAFEETEIEMFRKYSDYYGYVFYILQVE
ncbi:MAG TPA: class I SAM-dependent methyltransferase [Candidatus Bathyarchaeota archaeon]|mgnify:CR=1 FL=1|nr:class I SAM-dependent methyltransferase [Candidatus Bathyarchaeota archaeon]